jgi:hypothetical protein
MTAGSGFGRPQLGRIVRALSEPTPRLWAVALVLTLAVMALLLLPAHSGPGSTMDEGLLLVEPQRVRDGDLPNRDFESFYGPANTYALAGVYTFTGPDVLAERGVGLLYQLGIVAGVFALASPAGPVVAVAAGVTSGALTFTLGLAALAYFGGLAFALAGLFLLTRAATRPGASRRLFAFAGAAAGVAIAYRPQFALAIALAGLPLLLGRSPAAARRFAVGLVIGALPLLGHIVLAGPAPVFENLVVDAFFRSAPQSTRPFPPEIPSTVRLMVLVAAAIAVLVACAALSWWRAPGTPESRRVAAIALFCVGLAPQALGRLDGLHLVQVGCVAVALVPLGLASVPGPGWAHRARRLIPAAAFAAAVATLSWQYAHPMRAGYGAQLDRLLPWGEEAGADLREVSRGSRYFPLSSESAADEAGRTLAAIDGLTEPGDRIVVGPDDLRRTFYVDTYLYHLLPELEPGTYHLTMAPGTANRPGSRLPGDIARADVVVLGTLPEWEELAPHSELGSAEASEALVERFCLRAELSVHRVYERCRQ